MKTKIFITVIVAFLSVANIYAGNPDVIVYTNEETTEQGCVKEYTTVEKETLKPVSKTVYQYDSDNKIQRKIFYGWNEEQGWESIQKYDYEYNLNGQIITLVYTEWDEQLKTWSAQSEQLIHVYDLDGKFLAIKRLYINNAMGNLLAEK